MQVTAQIPGVNPPPAGDWLQHFYPGYFALVMATGIVSLAWHLQGAEALAQALFWLNVPAYVILWGITFCRFLRFRAEFLADLTSHARGAPFLTQVASTCVLGNQIVALTTFPSVAKWLWLAAVVLWLALTYTFFTAVTVREPKPALESAIHGGWLLIVVATESLCTLGTMVAPFFARPGLVLFASLMAYLVGAMFYLILITLILYRWMFKSMEPHMLTPPYWINMGALAITTLAGARLLVGSPPLALAIDLKPFIAGFTLFFWATATWWIPLLVVVGTWRHLWQRFPIAYDAQYWSLVFPLGMYSVATAIFANAMGLAFLKWVPLFFAAAALVTWAITFLGLCRHLFSAWRGRERRPSPAR